MKQSKIHHKLKQPKPKFSLINSHVTCNNIKIILSGAHLLRCWSLGNYDCSGHLKKMSHATSVGMGIKKGSSFIVFLRRHFVNDLKMKLQISTFSATIFCVFYIRVINGYLWKTDIRRGLIVPTSTTKIFFVDLDS